MEAAVASGTRSLAPRAGARVLLALAAAAGAGWGCAFDPHGVPGLDAWTEPWPDGRPPADAWVDGAAGDAAAPWPDARVTDAPPPLGPFGAPASIASLNSPSAVDDDPTLTGDLLELCFNSTRGGGNSDIWCATRPDRDAAWGTATRADALNSAEVETTPELSPDGLTIYLASARPGGAGDQDLYVATRSGRDRPWGAPTRVAALCSAGTDTAATPASDALTALVLTSTRPGGAGGVDLWASVRADATAAWGAPFALADVDTAATEADSWIDPGLRLLYLASDRPGSLGAWDLWVASRADPSSAFAPATPVVELNSVANDSDPWVAPDLRTIYFASDRAGSWDLYVATR